nr:hypothetical protein Iba_chr06cCG12150 [Ipomoea batatas]
MKGEREVMLKENAEKWKQLAKEANGGDVTFLETGDTNNAFLLSLSSPFMLPSSKLLIFNLTSGTTCASTLTLLLATVLPTACLLRCCAAVVGGGVLLARVLPTACLLRCCAAVVGGGVLTG